MAKAYKAPEGYEPPAFNLDTWREDEQEYLARLAARAQENGTSDLLGKVLRFQRADGYASYMVWNTKPFELIWIELGDAYSVEPALIRGLRVSDAREQIEREERWRARFPLKGGET